MSRYQNDPEYRAARQEYARKKARSDPGVYCFATTLTDTTTGEAIAGVVKVGRTGHMKSRIRDYKRHRSSRWELGPQEDLVFEPASSYAEACVAEDLIKGYLEGLLDKVPTKQEFFLCDNVRALAPLLSAAVLHARISVNSFSPPAIQW